MQLTLRRIWRLLSTTSPELTRMVGFGILSGADALTEGGRTFPTLPRCSTERAVLRGVQGANSASRLRKGDMKLWVWPRIKQ